MNTELAILLVDTFGYLHCREQLKLKFQTSHLSSIKECMM